MTERAFQTLRQTGRSELEIKRSRFLGHAEPVADEGAFRRLLERVKAVHSEASHNAFAYRLGRDAGAARFSDDGEPGGTAGRPMMEILIREDVVDAAVVVTRYFGGTLLGSGGLTRAYSQAASQALRAAGLVRMIPHAEMVVTLEYTHFGAVEKALQRAGIGLHEAAFTDVVTVKARVAAGGEAAFASLLADLTAGSAQVEIGGTVYLAE